MSQYFCPNTEDAQKRPRNIAKSESLRTQDTRGSRNLEHPGLYLENLTCFRVFCTEPIYQFIKNNTFLSFAF